jgi:hypothetical protein
VPFAECADTEPIWISHLRAQEGVGETGRLILVRSLDEALTTLAGPASYDGRLRVLLPQRCSSGLGTELLLWKRRGGTESQSEPRSS